MSREDELNEGIKYLSKALRKEKKVTEAAKEVSEEIAEERK